MIGWLHKNFVERIILQFMMYSAVKKFFTNHAFSKPKLLLRKYHFSH